MIIDHPYIKSAKIVSSARGSHGKTNKLVIETTVDLYSSWNEVADPKLLDLMDILAQLRSFAEHDFADFQSVEVKCPAMQRFIHSHQVDQNKITEFYSR